MRPILAIAALALCAGCAQPEKHKSRPSADVAIMKAPVEKARQITARVSEKVAVATSSVERAIALAEAIKSQEPALGKLKLELATTKKELTLAGEEIASLRLALDDAIAKGELLQRKVDDLGEWGSNQEERADRYQEKYARADKAIWNRNKMILGLSLALGGAALWIFRKPLMLAMAGAGI